MLGLDRRYVVGLGFLALASVGPAGAQENLDLGKTAAQLYAADCAICHKSPQGMTKNVGVFGLSSFLREHYTASRESAAVIAAYVESIDKGPPAAAKRPPGKRKAKENEKSNAKGDEKAKAALPGEDKPGENKSGKPKAGETKPEQAKTGETKPKTGKDEMPEKKPE